MIDNIRLFSDEEAYEAYVDSGDVTEPHVSYVVETEAVHYNPPKTTEP